jgi:hypothetical protein
MTIVVTADDHPGRRALVRATITADGYTLLEAADDRGGLSGGATPIGDMGEERVIQGPAPPA